MSEEKEEHLLNLQIVKIQKEIEKLDLEKASLQIDNQHKGAQFLITVGTIGSAVGGFSYG